MAKHAFKALKKLPEGVVAEVDQRLLAGQSPSEVGEWLQQELGHFTDLQPASLKKNLERYRKADLKAKVKAVAVEVVAENMMGLSAHAVKKRLDACDEMENLVARQIKRYEAAFKREEKLSHTGALLKQVTDEGRLLKEMLEKLGQLQLETGKLRRAPKTVTGQNYNPATGEVQQFSWTEEQAKLYETLDAVDVKALEDAPAPV